MSRRADHSTVKAKQRASIKYLLSKAYNHKTPEELAEPFYSDHDDVDRLKPHIVHALANAELYCMALSVLYQDPNFHNLNHWGIIQALARKSIYVAEPSDCSLTETVLIQTTPLKMSAHLAVTEALMSLFIKETVSLEAVRRTNSRLLSTTGGLLPPPQSSSSNEAESVLLAWVSTCLLALSQEEPGDEGGVPLPKESLPKIKAIADLSDGIGLCGVLALYRPQGLAWRELALSSSPPSMADSLYNIQLLTRACRSLGLPLHLSIEDIVYNHESIKLNILAFLADLYNGLEVAPGRDARLPGMPKERVIEVPDPDMHRMKSANGVKRTNSANMKERGFEDHQNDLIGGGGYSHQISGGVKGPHLSKEATNTDSKSDERGEADEEDHAVYSVSSPESRYPTTNSTRRHSNVFEQMKNIPTAGRPTSSVPSGRRSRRNSIDEYNNASSLSLENLGGSSENLSLLCRNPDKEMMRVHSGRKIPPSAPPPSSPPSSNGLDNRCLEDEGSHGGGNKQVVCFADLRRQKARDQFNSGINITYMQQEKEDLPKKGISSPEIIKSKTFQDSNISSSNSIHNNNGQSPGNENGNPEAMASQLNSVRLKLEQRRKRIEEEKKRMESVMAKQREKVGQEAFLRAVVKGDLNEDLKSVQSKWCSESPVGGVGQLPNTSGGDSSSGPSSPHKSTPGDDPESMDIESYSRSLHAMNDSLHDLQSDIQRLTQQQGQIQQMMTTTTNSPAHGGKQGNNMPVSPNPMDPQPFYISQPEGNQARRTWGQPQPISFAPDQSHWRRHPHDSWGRNGGRGGFQHHPSHMHNPMGGGYYGPQSSGYDPYSLRGDQWGGAGGQFPINQQQPMYNNVQQPYDGPQYGGGGNMMHHPNHAPHHPQYPPYPPMQQQHPPYYDQAYSSPPYNPPPQQSNPSNNPNNLGNQITPPPGSYNMSPSRTPFRLHETSPSTPSRTGTTPGTKVTVNNNSSAGRPDSSSSPRRVIHSSIPAPGEDDMAPQSVSFIEDSSANELPDEVDEPSPLGDPIAEVRVGDNKLSERLSNLNISSGSKTYRVSENSPSPTRQRPTLSSTFKQNRRGSGSGLTGESSGPSSLRSNPGGGGGAPLTEEEAETLSQMKTEKLKDDGNSGLGFVISFGDDAPKKPKPALKPRRPSTKRNNENHNNNNNNNNNNSGSDGSNSSRKENVPPDLMICIDMNMTEEPVVSPPYNKKNLKDEDSGVLWRDTGLPRFEADPNIELEPMIPLGGALDSSEEKKGEGLLIGGGGPGDSEEMQRKKERIMLQSLKRKQVAEENRLKKEEAARVRREAESSKEEEKVRKKDEERARKEAILEAHRLKKEMEKMEMENGRMPEPVSAKPVPKLRSKNGPLGSKGSSLSRRPRPRTIHVDGADAGSLMSGSKRGSSSNISGSNLYRTESRSSVNDPHNNNSSPSLSIANMGKGGGGKGPSVSRPNSRARRGSQAALIDESGSLAALHSSPGPDWAFKRKASSSAASVEGSPRLSRIDRRSASTPRGKRDHSVSSAYAGDDISRLNGRMRGENYRGSRDSLTSGLTYSAARRGSNASVYDEHDYYYGGSMRDLSGRQLGRARKASSSSHIGPGSLPGYSRRGRGSAGGGGDFDDGASDISSTASGFSAYGYRSGTRLYREPTTKSNRPILLNAIEFVVFPGVVNAETRNRVLSVIDRCDCSHFLLLFRDQKCQFRGLYAFYPDTDEVYKIYGTGPKAVTDKMFETYFKYNSGGKKFTKIHTKHLSVTIDAFTIHNSLWLGKKAKLPDKRDMALVI